MQKITPFLWYDNQAEEAVDFYTSLFKNAKKGNVSRWTEGSPGPVGQAIVVEFELEGQKFLALNGGPLFKFNESVSFMINCETQEEVDHFWDKLLEGGEPSQCGWLKDRYGLSWQVTPTALGRLMTGGTAAQSQAVMGAMMQMVKLEIAPLQAAFDGAAQPVG